MMPIDPAKEAEQLAQIFFNLSTALDRFRLANYSAIPQAKQQQLKQQAQALDTRGQQFTAEALGAILQTIRPHLQNIQQATRDAQDTLEHLTDVQKAFTIADSAVALAGAIVAGDLGSIADNVQGIYAAIKG